MDLLQVAGNTITNVKAAVDALTARLAAAERLSLHDHQGGGLFTSVEERLTALERAPPPFVDAELRGRLTAIQDRLAALEAGRGLPAPTEVYMPAPEAPAQPEEPSHEAQPEEEPAPEAPAPAQPEEPSHEAQPEEEPAPEAPAQPDEAPEPNTSRAPVAGSKPRARGGRRAAQ